MSESLDHAKEVARAVVTDVSELDSVPRQVLVGGTALTIVAKEMGGSQWLLGSALSIAYEHTHNPILAALAMGLTSLTVESALSTGVASHLSEFNNTAKALEHVHASRPDWHEGHHHSRKVDRAIKLYNRVMLAVVLGASGIVIDEFARNPSADRKRLTMRGLKIGGNLAILNTVGGLALGGGIKLAEHLGHEQVAEGAIHLLRNPLLYLGMVTFGAVARGAYRTRRKYQVRRQAQIPEQPGPDQDREEQ